MFQCTVHVYLQALQTEVFSGLVLFLELKIENILARWFHSRQWLSRWKAPGCLLVGWAGMRPVALYQVHKNNTSATVYLVHQNKYQVHTHCTRYTRTKHLLRCTWFPQNKAAVPTKTLTTVYQVHQNKSLGAVYTSVHKTPGTVYTRAVHSWC